MKNKYAYELDFYGDRWTGNGHGIVNVSGNTPEQQKIVDEWNAAHESVQKETPSKNKPRKRAIPDNT